MLFDAAHQCGMIAGGVWANPLDEGAHLMTMSTYKSLGGPAGGLIVTNDAAIAERLDAIAFPGLTANFDAAKSAALAITLLDWRDFGAAYAQAMVDLARRWRARLRQGLPVFAADRGITTSHQFAHRGGGLRRRPGGVEDAAQGRVPRLRHRPAAGRGGGRHERAAHRHARAGAPGRHACGCPRLAALIAEGLRSNAPETVAARTRALRGTFTGLHYMRG